MSARCAAAALVLVLAAPAAPAESIFRCGDSYSQTPCANAKVVDVVGAASDAQRAEARAVATREKQLALEMVRDRRERENALRPAMAGSLGPAPPPRPVATPPAKKHPRSRTHLAPGDDGRDFVASVPRSKK